MRLLINASTLSATGVTQVATSFIYECVNYTQNSYYVFLSKTVKEQIDVNSFPANFIFYLIESHPLYGISGFHARKKMRKLEQSIKPDVVFTIFGPAWWTPKAPHLQGYAYPIYIYKDSPFFKKISFLEKLKYIIYENIHLTALLKNGHYFVTEAEDVTDRISKLLKIPSDHIFTVGNTANQFFLKYTPPESSKKILPCSENEYRFVTLAAPIKHKNLEIINEVIPILLRRGCRGFKFILTIKDDRVLRSMYTPESLKFIINLGRVPVADCPELLYESDAVFLPTLLECFSASYPEAMVMGKPILTSDLSFAKSVCGDAALYFNPMDAEDIADKMILIMEDQLLRDKLVTKGYAKFKELETSASRTQKYLNICECLVHEE